MKEIERILTLHQVAEMMCVSTNAIYLSIRRGTLAVHKPGEKPPRIALADVVRRLDEKYGVESTANGVGVDPFSQLARILTYQEAADYIGISVATLKNRVGHGRRPRPIKCEMNGGWSFRLADIVEAMDNPKLSCCNPENAAYQKAVDQRNAMHKRSCNLRYEWIDAKCPYCSVAHKKRVVKGSTKWIYCEQHQCLRNARNQSVYRVGLESLQEYR